MGERFDARKAATNVAHTVGNKISSAEQAVFKTGFRAADSLTTGYMAKLEESGKEPRTSRYVHDFLHPEDVDETEASLITQTQEAHGISLHLPEVTEDEKALLLQAFSAYRDICRGAADEHVNPNRSAAVREALIRFQSAMFFVLGFPEALAVKQWGPDLAQSIGAYGGNDEHWGELWLRVGPDYGEGSNKTTYFDWGSSLWLSDTGTVREAEHPLRTHKAVKGEIVDPEPAPAPRQNVKENKGGGGSRERRSTAGGAPVSHDQILNEERHNPNNRTDADARRAAKQRYEDQFRGKRKGSDDW